MVRLLLLLAFLLPVPASAATAADIARAIRENSFDRDECYRVRDLSFVKEDIRLYLTDGHLIFSKPVAGQPHRRRLLRRCRRRRRRGDPASRPTAPSAARWPPSSTRPTSTNTSAPSSCSSPATSTSSSKRRSPPIPAIARRPKSRRCSTQKWSPVLRNLGTSYQVRLTLDLLGAPARGGLFAALFSSTKLGNFDIVYDPDNAEQILAGQINNRENRLYFDTWTSFPSRSSRKDPKPVLRDAEMQDYRIDATVAPDLSLERGHARQGARQRIPAAGAQFRYRARNVGYGSARRWRTRRGAAGRKPCASTSRAAATISSSWCRPSRCEPGRDYEFEFHHSGKVIHDAGDHVFYVSARGNWYPASGLRFANYDLTFRFPRELDLVGAGDIVEDRTEGDTRMVRRRTERADSHRRLQSRRLRARAPGARRLRRRCLRQPQTRDRAAASPHHAAAQQPAHRRGISRRRPDPLDARHVHRRARAQPHRASADARRRSRLRHGIHGVEIRAAGAAAPHRLADSRRLRTRLSRASSISPRSPTSRIFPAPASTAPAPTAEIFFGDVLQAHETAHQWWGNRVTAATYRDNWLMEALANYVRAALSRETPRQCTPWNRCWITTARRCSPRANPASRWMPPARSCSARAWRPRRSRAPGAPSPTARGAGSCRCCAPAWAPDRFLALLAEIGKRYDRKEITTEEFRLLAAEFPPAEIRRPETGELLRTVGLRHRHPRHEAVLHRERRRAQREAHRHPDAIRRGRGFHRLRPGGNPDRPR